MLDWHKRTFHPFNRSLKFSCNVPGCSRQGDRGFPELRGLTQHMLIKHCDEGDWPCDAPGCERVFVQKSSLLYHKCTEHPKNASCNFPCDVPSCSLVGDDAFRRPSQL